MTLKESIELNKKLYLTEEDVSFLIDHGSPFDNPNYAKYFDDMMDSIPQENFFSFIGSDNKKCYLETDKKQWAKICFSWMLNYNKDLSVPAEKLAKVCFKVFYGENIENCDKNTPHTPLYTVRDGRVEIGNIKL